MHTLEINKFVGAILMTVLVAMVSSFLGDILVPAGGHGPVAHAPTAGEQAPTAAPKPEKELPLGNLLAAASAEKGEKIAKSRCTSCHTFEKGGANKVGPNLHGVIGRAKGSHEGFAYSAGVKEKGGVWTYEDVYAYLHKPTAFIKGSKMAFQLASPEDRASVILYLRTLTDNPPPLPKPEEIKPAEAKKATEKTAEAPKAAEPAKPAAPQEAKKPEAAQPLGAILATGDAGRGARLAKTRCAACHSFDKGGANKVGPNLHGVVGRARASHEGYAYSSAMKGKPGNWTYEDLFDYLNDPSAFAKGTKMTFKLTKPQERADIIAYLRTVTENPPPLPAK